jgi:hypothetical protein
MYRLYLDLSKGNNVHCWANKIKQLIGNLGYNNLLVNFRQDVNYFPAMKQRIRDQFIQSWNNATLNISKLDHYRKYKMCFGYESYLSIIRNDNLRKCSTCFRLCSHNLEIVFGRFIGSQRHERICKMCNTKMIESEYHFLLTCPACVDLRGKYLGNCSRPNVQKFVNIMSYSSKC